MQKYNFAFFGNSHFSVIVLDGLKRAGLLPRLIITSEDKPKGRKLVLTPPEAKIWAVQNNIPFIQNLTELSGDFDFFIVASYGKILPKEILDLPRKGTLNVHPSLLPKLRGPSPLQTSILTENETGVTIILLDEKMDHGPMLVQEKVNVPEWPPYKKDLEEILGKAGGKLLAKIIPDYMSGNITPVEQNHLQATFTKKIEKSDAELNFYDSPETNLRKIRAYQEWPGAFFFKKKKRIIVKTAHIKNDELVLDRVIPEGKKEMNYKDFLRGLDR